MHRGYVKLWRKITEWEWFDDANTFRLFIYLLLHANHTPKKWRGIDIDRGEFLTSRDKLAKALKISVKNVLTSERRLKETNELANKTTNKYSLYRLLNYDFYNPLDKQEDDQTASKGQASDKQRATTNKEEELEELRREEEGVLPKEKEETPGVKMQKFLLSVKEKDEDFLKLSEILVEKGMKEEVVMSELEKFARYWGELNKTGKKQRWETEKTFEVNRRLATWFANADKWSGGKSQDIDVNSVMF